MPDNSEPNSQRDRLWKPGQSGNPRGKPKGARHRATQLAEAMIGAEAEGVIRKVIEGALAGDTVCLRLVMERIAPPAKEKPAALRLPSIKTIDDTVTALATVAEQFGDGAILASEAATAVTLIDACRKALETQDLERRVAALEADREVQP